MAQEGIYKNPILLNQALHKSVKISKVNNFNFTRDLNSVLITGQEFLEASKHYPIAFIPNKKGDIVPVAILGLQQKGNLFVDDAGKWKEGTYIPAFIRRYPFILAENDSSGENFSVSVDAAYEGFDKGEGVALFDDAGSPTNDLNKIIESLKQYQMQNSITQEFVKKLTEYNLLKDFAAGVTLPGGEKYGLKGLKMVDEKALVGLDDDKALDLFRKGYLGWIYGHLISLPNFKVLGAAEMKKAAADKEQ